MLASELKSEKVLDWLLEEDQPSIRNQALRQLLHKQEGEPEVRRAQVAITKTGWAAEILRDQLPKGYWNNTESLIRPKYLATFWKFLVLVDLGLSAKEQRVQLTCELLLDKCVRNDGSFSFWRESHFCSTGLLARALILCGYGEDSRVVRALDWIVDA